MDGQDINELATKIRHFYDLYFLVNDTECYQPHTLSPLLTDFDTVWQKLRNTYETNIPPLAYIKPIPEAEKAAEAFEQIAQVLRTL